MLAGGAAGSGFDPAELPFVGRGSQGVVTAGATLFVWPVFFPVLTLGFLAGVWEGGFPEDGFVDSGAVGLEGACCTLVGALPAESDCGIDRPTTPGSTDAKQLANNRMAVARVIRSLEG